MNIIKMGVQISEGPLYQRHQVAALVDEECLIITHEYGNLL